MNNNYTDYIYYLVILGLPMMVISGFLGVSRAIILLSFMVLVVVYYIVANIRAKSNPEDRIFGITGVQRSVKMFVVLLAMLILHRIDIYLNITY